MAGAEKCCECPKSDCEYHAWEMYNYKRNHLQINPECRDQFKGTTAEIFMLVNQDLDSDIYHVHFGKGGWRTSLYHKDDFWWNGTLYNEGQFKRYPRPYQRICLTPVKKWFAFEVAVYVKEHDMVYFNTIYDIRKFKKNMTKLFGYLPKINRLKKKDLKGFESEYYAFRHHIKNVKGIDTDDL